MKKFILALSLIILFSSCEKANLNISDTNIENRLYSMVGENINAVSNTLKKEGFQKFQIDNQINFTRNKEVYIFKTSKKTIISAAYQLNDSTKSIKLYDEYRNVFLSKNTDNYEAFIWADNFLDFGKNYVDSVYVNVDEYIYFYDDPLKFYTVLQSNLFFLKTASESWYNGKINQDEMWNIQLGEKAKTTLISYSDFSIIK